MAAVDPAAERVVAKQVVLEFFASVVGPGDAAAAASLIAPDLRDHTFEATGFAAVELFLESCSAAAPRLPEPVFTVADGDLVTILHHLPQPSPQEPGASYDYFWSNTFRVRGRRIVESWPGINRIAPLRAPGTAREAAIDVGVADPEQLEANRALAHDFFLHIFEGRNPAAAARFVTDDYRQHGGDIPQGRAGLEALVGDLFPDGPVPVPPVLPNPPVHILAEGEIVVVVPCLPQPDPDDPSRRYPLHLHDSFRVRDGKLCDHWSGVDRAAPPRQ